MPPLTQVDKDALAAKIAAAQAQIPALEDEINKARLAKIDTTDYTSRLNALKEQIRLLNLHYFGK